MAKKRSGPTFESARPSDEISRGVLRDLVGAFRLLADDTRLRLLVDLAQHGERNVGELCTRLGLNQPALSHHLALLRVSGFVDTRRSGKHQFYSIRPEALGDIIAQTLAATGQGPRKLRFHDFTLTYHGE